MPISLHAEVIDLDQDGIFDNEDQEVIVSSSQSLAAGEYFFNTLTIVNGSVLTLVSDPQASGDFKGVKINAENITIESGSALSANGTGYANNGASPGGGDYNGGYGYGGEGGDWYYREENAFGGDTYGSAFEPKDLGSGGELKAAGGGAIWLAISGTLENNGTISANGARQQASGGSIYVQTGSLGGTGTFTANGAGCASYFPYSGAGGGGRTAVYYGGSSFTGSAEVLRGSVGWGDSCQGERAGQDGTVIFVDTTNNDLYLYDRILFQASASPYTFNRIILLDSATVRAEPGVSITAHAVHLDEGSSFDTKGIDSFTMDSLLIEGDSTFTSAEGQLLAVTSLTLRNGGVAQFGRGETLGVFDIITLENDSTITTAPMHILHLEARDITLDETSAISVTGMGYAPRSGPGFNDSGAGASHGGLGQSGAPSPVYGSATEPVDFGSGGSPDAHGGGSLRIIVSGILENNGAISADAEPMKNGASGGSVYVTTDTLSGSGSFTALGGNTRGYITEVGAGGGGRIAVYYNESDFVGTTSARGGDVGGSSMQTYYAQDGTVVFEQVVPKGPSSVLFLPGIQASRLYIKDEDGDEDRLWEPHGNQDIRQLEMTEEGKSVESIYTRDVIDAAYGVKDVYNKFSAFMDQLAGQKIIKAWEPFAYDWRYGVVDIAHNGTQYEDAIHDAVKAIESLREDSFSEKVTIVAHSNGGLLAKAILTRLEQEGKSDLVDKVILLASPQLGTPKAIGVLLHGYDQEQGYGFLMDDAEIRTVAKNMPGVYGLLPSQKYFEKSGSVPVTFGAGVSTQAFIDAYGATVDSTAELTEFMVGAIDERPAATEIYEASQAQRSMLENTFSEHNTILDTWVAPEGVEVIEVVGIGLNTVHQFKYEQFMERKCLLCAREPIYKPVPQFSPYGDETVMGYSAEGYEGDKQTYYVDLGALENENNPEAVEHADFANNKSIQNLIRNIFTDGSSTTPFVHITRPLFSGTSYTILSTHSPVSLEVVDSEGRRVGKGTSTLQTDIPGSTYMEVAGSAYIVVPEGIEYDVSIRGTGYGSMTFVTESLTEGTQTRMSFAEVSTITPSTTIAISVAENTFSNLIVDVNGDNVIDQEITVQGEIVVPKGTYLELRNTINALPVYYGYKQHLLALTNLAEHFDKKSLTKKRFAKFETRILVRIGQMLTHAVKKKQLTQAQIAPVLKAINDLK